VQTDLKGPDYINPLAWTRIVKDLVGLKNFPSFEGFYEYLTGNYAKFKSIYFGDDLKKIILPGEWNETLKPFHKLLF